MIYRKTNWQTDSDTRASFFSPIGLKKKCHDFWAATESSNEKVAIGQFGKTLNYVQSPLSGWIQLLQLLPE